MTSNRVAIVALAEQFNNAVDCFEYVQISKKCTKDYTTYQLRLDCARLRLSRWGDSVGLSGDIRCKRDVQDAMLGSDDEKAVAQSLLAQVNDLFVQASTSSRYKAYDRPNGEGLELYESRVDLEQRSLTLHQAMRSLSFRRRNSESLSSKTQWALYEKTDFSRLIESVSSLLGQLESIFFKAYPALLKACEQDVALLGSAGDLTTLKAIAKKEDWYLAAVIGNLSQPQPAFAGGNHVTNNWGSVVGVNPGSITINHYPHAGTQVRQ